MFKMNSDKTIKFELITDFGLLKDINHQPKKACCFSRFSKFKFENFIGIINIHGTLNTYYLCLMNI